jgi:hypothetical protein
MEDEEQDVKEEAKQQTTLTSLGNFKRQKVSSTKEQTIHHPQENPYQKTYNTGLRQQQQQ